MLESHCLPEPAAKIASIRAGGKGMPISAGRHHRVARIGHRDDAGRQRDRFADQPIGIALAVEPLMVPAHGRAKVRQPADVGDDPLARHRVLPDMREFRGGQRAWFQEHVISNADLADIVQ